MDDPLEQLWRTYELERPTWAAVGSRVAEALDRMTRARGILCTVTSRTKDVASLLRKAIIKDRVADLQAIRDKAGVRVSVAFPDDLPEVCDILRAQKQFDRRGEEDKIDLLGDTRIGYLGIHFDLVVPIDELPDGLPAVAGELWCEVQVQTAAQTLYSVVSHPLTYKTPIEPPLDVSRAIKRLSVLGEIFDNELRLARESIMKQRDYPLARLMFSLEQQFLALTGRQGDPGATRLIVEALAPLYGTDPIEVVEARFEDFVSERADNLRFIYEHNREHASHPFIMLPASLMVFERLEADPFALKDRWTAAGLSLTTLEQLSASYGQPIGV